MRGWLDKLSPWGQGPCLLTLAPRPHHLVTWWKYSMLHLFDEFLKASISFHCIDRKKDSGKRCQLPSGTKHDRLAALEGTWLCVATCIWTPFYLGGIPSLIRNWNSLSQKSWKIPAHPFPASLAAKTQIYALLIRPLGQFFTWELMRQRKRTKGCGCHDGWNAEFLAQKRPGTHSNSRSWVPAQKWQWCKSGI